MELEYDNEHMGWINDIQFLHRPDHIGIRVSPSVNKFAGSYELTMGRGTAYIEHGNFLVSTAIFEIVGEGAQIRWEVGDGA